jgi:hypothetical protein
MRLPKAGARRLAAGAVATFVLAGGGGLAYAEVAAGSPAAAPTATVTASSPSTSTPPSKAKADHRPGLLRRAVHIEAVVRTKSGYETVDVDRGTVASISPTSITITRPDGPQVSANITPTTKFRGVQQSQIQDGQTVRVVQTGGNALQIAERPPSGSSASSGPAQGSAQAQSSTT